MNYSEAVYFNGDHCAHCAQWYEHKRTVRRSELAERVLRRMPR